MTSTVITRWFGYGLLLILGLIVLHAPLSVAISSALPDLELLAKAWKEVLLLLLGIVAAGLLSLKGLWSRFLGDRIVQLSLAYIGLHIILGLIIPLGGLQIIAGLMIDLRFVVFLLLCYVGALVVPGILKSASLVTATGAVVVIGFGLLQITVLPDDVLRFMGYSNETIRPFTTIDRNPDFVRIHSTLRGPNPLGALALVYLALALAYLRQIWHTRAGVVKRWWTVWAAVIGSIAVLFATYSRSAYGAAFIAATCLGASIWKPSRKALVLGLVSVSLVAGSLMVLQSTDWYSNVILHEDPESTVLNKSNEDHVESLKDGLALIAVQPFGAGVGSTGSASLYDNSPANDRIIENYYLFVAHESGWLGLGLLVALFVLIMHRLWLKRKHWLGLGLFASGIGLAAIGLLLPVWADDTVSLIWWGLAGIVIGSGIIKGDARGTRQQKATRASSIR